MFLPKPTINDVTEALEAFKNITIPEGDFEGDAVNSPYLYQSLSVKDQKIVDHAEHVVSEYVRKPGDFGDEANARSLTEMRKRGFPVSLNPDQYEHDRLVGIAESHGLILDLSDPSTNAED